MDTHAEYRIVFRRFGYVLLLILALLVSSCAKRYFRDAGTPPYPPPHLTLFERPHQEYWTGIVFNGNKVGFSHFTLSPSKEITCCFDVRSEATLRIRFLMLDKKINLKSHDQIAEDLSLHSFSYEYNLDGNHMKLNGKRTNSTLDVLIETKGQKVHDIIPVTGKLYPTSIIGLYPVIHGLELGRTYTYDVYDGETQTVSSVEQKIMAYEESDLFQGPAFKINTRFHGQEATTWMDAQGRPLLEMSLGGVIISELESKSKAVEYLAQAAINKKETLLDFSLIKSDTHIQDPRQIKLMEIAITGIDKVVDIPVDERQQCRPVGNEIFCRITAQLQDMEESPPTSVKDVSKKYLEPSYIIPSRNPLLYQTATEIVVNANLRYHQIRLLVDWIQENIKKEPVDVFSALDVFHNRKAECQGHTYLYTAFARSLDIPTRVANGIVYSSEHKGFLYHTWAESFVNGCWVSVDPTFGQVPADASHIKFIEGERVSDVLPLVNLIGQITVRIVKIKS